ncbi:MAG: citrate lyase subunit alpha [Candidatus Thermoplasmatota archaeon]
MVRNAVGREIPQRVPGRRLRPFMGAWASPPEPKKMRIAQHIVHSGPGADKLLGSLEKAIDLVGLKDGMTISFHHHLRNGDHVILQVLDAIAAKGIKNLRMGHSSMFPIHEPIVEHIKSGVVTRIEGNLNGPVGHYVSKHPLTTPVVIRSHGGRTRALECGELEIDVAFLAASASDGQGNCNGVLGRGMFGPMGFAIADSWYARKVVIITDNIVDYPCTPISIPEHRVDYVVQVDKIGDPEGIASGTTEITTDPARLKLASDVIDMMEAAGLIKEGLMFQAGAGGTTLAVVKYLHERMKDRGLTGHFAVGGITGLVVEMLHEGTVRKILDAQAFDIPAINSLREDPNHVEISHYHFGNPHSKGCVTHMLDTCFMGATEVDVDFNVNVNTHSDGILLHGTGGHADAAAGSRVTFIITPIVRKRVPILRDAVTTVTTPGDTVDIVVTDHGVAVNPRRREIIEKLRSGGVKLCTIEALRDAAYGMTGKPDQLHWGRKIVGIIEYRDGTVTDVVRQVEEG